MSATDRMWLGNWIAECNLRSDMPEHARHLDRYGQSRNMLRSEVQKYRDEGMKLMRDFAESSAKQLFEDKDPTVIPYAARMLFQDILREQQLPPLTQKGYGKGKSSHKQMYEDAISETSSQKDYFGGKKPDTDDQYPGPFSKPQNSLQKMMTLGWAKDFHPGNQKAYQALLGQVGNIFPQFPPGLSCRTVPEKWEEFWEQFDGQCYFSCIPKDLAAMMMKLTYPSGTNVADALVGLRISDGTLQQATYDQIKQLLLEHSGPKGDVLLLRAQERIETWSRRLGERLQTAFYRLERYRAYALEKDPNTQRSPIWYANLIFHNSGLTKEEQTRIWHDPSVNAILDYDKIKAAMFRFYDETHLLDMLRLKNSKSVRTNPNRTYICDDPANDIAGTPITQDMIDDDGTDLVTMSPEPGKPFTVNLVRSKVPDEISKQLELSGDSQFFDPLDELNDVLWTTADDDGLSEVSDAGFDSTTDVDDTPEYDDDDEDYDSEYSEGYDDDWYPESWEQDWDSEDWNEEDDMEDYCDEIVEVFVCNARADAEGSGTAFDEEKAYEMGEQFLDTYLVKKGKGKGKGQRRGRSKGKGRGKGKGRRPKGKGKGGGFRRSKGRPKGRARDPSKGNRKGPNRSRSQTRGYDANKAGKALRGDKNVPLNHKAKGKKCPMCNNRNAAGRMVVGHDPGDPICPKVQTGQHPEHPKWKPVRDRMQKNEHQKRPLLKRRKGSGKGSSGKGFRGKGKGPHSINMVVPTDDPSVATDSATGTLATAVSNSDQLLTDFAVSGTSAKREDSPEEFIEAGRMNSPTWKNLLRGQEPVNSTDVYAFSSFGGSTTESLAGESTVTVEYLQSVDESHPAPPQQWHFITGWKQHLVFAWPTEVFGRKRIRAALLASEKTVTSADDYSDYQGAVRVTVCCLKCSYGKDPSEALLASCSASPPLDESFPQELLDEGQRDASWYAKCPNCGPGSFDVLSIPNLLKFIESDGHPGPSVGKSGLENSKVSLCPYHTSEPCEDAHCQTHTSYGPVKSRRHDANPYKRHSTSGKPTLEEDESVATMLNLGKDTIAHLSPTFDTANSVPQAMATEEPQPVATQLVSSQVTFGAETPGIYAFRHHHKENDIFNIIDRYISGDPLSEQDMTHGVYYTEQPDVKNWYYRTLRDRLDQDKQIAWQRQQKERAQLQAFRENFVREHNATSSVKLPVQEPSQRTSFEKNRDLFIYPRFELYSDRIRELSKQYLDWDTQDLQTNVGSLEVNRLKWEPSLSRYRFRDHLPKDDTDIPAAMHAELCRRGIATGHWHLAEQNKCAQEQGHSTARARASAISLPFGTQAVKPTPVVVGPPDRLACTECSCGMDNTACKACGQHGHHIQCCPVRRAADFERSVTDQQNLEEFLRKQAAMQLRMDSNSQNPDIDKPSGDLFHGIGKPSDLEPKTRSTYDGPMSSVAPPYPRDHSTNMLEHLRGLPKETQVTAQQELEAGIRKQIEKVSARATGVHGKTADGKNRSMPPNEYELWKEANKEQIRKLIPLAGNTKQQQAHRLFSQYKEDKDKKAAEERAAILAQKLDLNTCRTEELEYLQILSQATCAQIVSNRKNLPDGKYTEWKQLTGVYGIGEKLLHKLRPFLKDLPGSSLPVSTATSSSSPSPQSGTPTQPYSINVIPDVRVSNPRFPHPFSEAFFEEMFLPTLFGNIKCEENKMVCEICGRPADPANRCVGCDIPLCDRCYKDGNNCVCGVPPIMLSPPKTVQFGISEVFEVGPVSESKITEEPKCILKQHHMEVHPQITLVVKTPRKPGLLWFDTGCKRCVTGPEYHDLMQAKLKTIGLKPIKLHISEDFIFGDGKIDTSDCAFMYPSFVGNEWTGGVDMARCTVPCPPLFSLKMAKLWDCSTHHGRQELTVGKYNKTFPFIGGVPYVDILDFDPATVDLSEVPLDFFIN